MTAVTADPVLVIPDGVAPPDRRFWVTEDMIPKDRFDLPVPRYNVIQTANFFFARSDSWLRLLIRPDERHPQGHFVLDGTRLVFRRVPRGLRTQEDPDDVESLPSAPPEPGPGDPRFFSLADVEMMAYALAQQGTINENKFVCAVQTVKWVARNYGIIKD